jgi:hypothetical protein
MERDLSQVDLWEESLARSRARRAREQTRRQHRSVELGRLGPAGLGGISAAAVLAATLPGLLSGRGAPQAQRAAYKVENSGHSISPRLVAQTLAKRPAFHAASHAASGITAGSARVAPSEHFVSAAPKTTAHHKPPAAAPPSQTFLTATHSTPKHGSAANHNLIEAALARSAHKRSPHASGSGGGGLSGSTHASSHHKSHPSPSPSSGNDSSHGNSGSSSHSSSSSSHKASSNSGGGGIGRQSGSGSGSGGYVNPLADAHVTPERIDQGVDYSGSGPLDALGDGQITYVGTSNTGWPGAFIEFRLLNGPDAGRYVYYAETISPARGLHVGEKVSAGQTIATINGGIEIGWGANVGTETYAMQHGQWSSSDDANSVATPAGKNFSDLIASLGAPPGKVEG